MGSGQRLEGSPCGEPSRHTAGATWPSSHPDGVLWWLQPLGREACRGVGVGVGGRGETAAATAFPAAPDASAEGRLASLEPGRLSPSPGRFSRTEGAFCAGAARQSLAGRWILEAVGRRGREATIPPSPAAGGSWEPGVLTGRRKAFAVGFCAGVGIERLLLFMRRT